MKIVYLHQYFVTPRMPGGTRSYEMARRLVAAGHEVHIVTSDRERAGGGWLVTQEDGIQVHWIGVPYANAMSYAGRTAAFARFALLAAARAASLRGDVVFATSTPLTIALPAIYASRIRRVPMVFEVRDLWPDVPIAVGALRNPLLILLARLLEWLAYHAAAQVVALSPGMAEGVIRRGIDPGRVTVIPNGCDIDRFDVPPGRGDHVRRQLGLGEGQPLVVYTGTFGRVNGSGYLVELAACDASREIGFLLVGSGYERESLLARAEALGVLGRNLFIWETLPKDQMPDLLAASTVACSVVIPVKAMWNNSANKFFDGLAAGRPVAINHGGWQADLLRQTGAGIVLPPDDIPAAARLLADFVGSDPRLQAARAAARQLAREQFGRAELAARLESLLRKAAAR